MTSRERSKDQTRFAGEKLRITCGLLLLRSSHGENRLARSACPPMMIGRSKGTGLELRTRTHERWWSRLSSALTLVAYLVLLGYSHLHLALEAHEHGSPAEHASEHAHDSDEEHEPHSAAEHSMAASPPCLGKAEQFIVSDLVTVAVAVVIRPLAGSFVGSWIVDLPRHPPPRLLEQPRSPPFV